MNNPFINLNTFYPIPGYDGMYEINIKGEIKSNKTNKIKKPNKNKIQLWKDGKVYTYSINKLLKDIFGYTIECLNFMYSGYNSDVPKYISNKGEIYIFNQYLINSKGDIFSLYYNRIISVNRNAKGYCYVILYNENIYKRCSIHRLVASTFIPNPHNLPQVNHIDGNKENNHVSNLEWCDQEYNMNHAYDNRLNTRNKSIIALDIITNKEYKFRSILEASKTLPVSYNTICKYLDTNNVYNNQWVFKNSNAIK